MDLVEPLLFDLEHRVDAVLLYESELFKDICWGLWPQSRPRKLDAGSTFVGRGYNTIA